MKIRALKIVTVLPKVTNLGSKIGHRMDYNGVRVLRGSPLHPPLGSEQEKTSEIPALNFAFA